MTSWMHPTLALLGAVAPTHGTACCTGCGDTFAYRVSAPAPCLCPDCWSDAHPYTCLGCGAAIPAEVEQQHHGEQVFAGRFVAPVDWTSWTCPACGRHGDSDEEACIAETERLRREGVL